MDHLQNRQSLEILRHLVSGAAVNVNINALSRHLGLHRATVKNRIQALFDARIINPPNYPFLLLFEEYPLLVLARADMPRSAQVIEFFRDESNIFAAFSCMEGPYNTLLIEFFKDMESYHSWRERIVQEQKIPAREMRAAANVDFFSNKLAFKYDPSCFVHELRREFDANGRLDIGGMTLDEGTFSLLDLLLSGEFIRTNDSLIARDLGTNRKTVTRRVDMLLRDGVVGRPRCFFPNLLTPPGFNLIISMVEVTSRKAEIVDYIMSSSHVPRALEISTGRYNILMFSAFRTVEEFFTWGEEITSSFRGAIGAITNTILSSHMIHTIKNQKVSLGLIERRLWEQKQRD